MRIDFLFINIIGVIISLFSLYVTYNLYSKYKLRRTLWFAFTGFNIFVWNIAHVLYDIIPEDNYSLARFAFIIANVGGMFIILGTLHVFSSLTHQHIKIEVIIYDVILTFFLSMIIFRSDFVDIQYNSINKSWNSVINNSIVWNLYTMFILLFLIKELYYPLIKNYNISHKENKKYILYLIAFSLIGPLGNSLLPILNLLGLVPVFRYIFANLGFLGIFYIFWKKPFIGIHDNVEILKIMINNNIGIPVFSTSDIVDAAMSSAALHGINAIFDEITGSEEFFSEDDIETKRMIELKENNFLILREDIHVVIFHYSTNSGVCVSKFTSLARIFTEDMDEQAKIDKFKNAFSEYYPRYSEFIKMDGMIL